MTGRQSPTPLILGPDTPLPPGEKWSPIVQIKLILYFCSCFILLSLLPNSIWDPEGQEIIYVIGDPYDSETNPRRRQDSARQLLQQVRGDRNGVG